MKQRLDVADVELAGGGHAFDLTLPQGARVIRCRLVYRNKKLIINMERPPLVPWLQLVIAMDPDRQPVTRRFLILPQRMTVESRQSIEFVGWADDPDTTNNPDGTIAVYEEIRVRCDRAGDPGVRELEHVYNREATDRCECGETVRDWECAIPGHGHVFFPGSDWCKCGGMRSDGTPAG